MKTLETRIMIYTSLYKEMCDFYQNTLGFSIKITFEHGTMFDTGSSIIEIFEDIQASQTLLKLSMEVSSVLDIWDRLSQRSQISHILRFNHWGDTSFGVLDPAGNELIFFSSGKFV